jgi:transmembrane protein 33
MASNSLTDRLLRQAQSLQSVWFLGHVSMLWFSFRYALFYISMKSYTSWAAFSYRVAFFSAAVTYGIVVYKGFRARVRQGRSTGALALAGDENVQYLGKSFASRYEIANDESAMALVWLVSRQLPLALIPFAVYSIFHVATYIRGNILPTIYPPTSTPAPSSSSDAARPRPTGAVADAIGNFIRDYYDASMTIVALLEIILWFRLLFPAIIFTKGSWILIAVYTVFLRARFAQSKFVRDALANLGARADALVAQQGMDPRLRQGWEGAKGGLGKFVELTDVNKYLNRGQPQPVRKAQ